jgi:DUF4097 and DUF4098 domain-containing protein YvlB
MRNKVVLGILWTGLLVTGCDLDVDFGDWGDDWGRVKYERIEELQRPLASGAKVKVSTASGSIEIIGASTDQCHVIAKITARAPSEEEAQALAQQVDIRFEPLGKGWKIEAERPKHLKRRSVSISYKITVPYQTHIDCSSASGSLDVMYIHGEVQAHAASGSVEARDIQGSVELRSASGSVCCERLSQGDAQLHTASGSVRLLQASDIGHGNLSAASGSVTARGITAGNLHMHSSSGSVILLDAAVTEEINMDTSSGGVEAESVSCSTITAKSVSGGVNVTLTSQTPGHVKVHGSSTSGSVNITLPPDFGGQVDLSTTSGSIHSDLPILVQGELSKRHQCGTIGQGQGRLYARTVSGSIHIH